MHEELSDVTLPIYQLSSSRIRLRCRLLTTIPSIAMIHIHRTFFAQALLDHPNNPLASPYAPSFLAANRCASVLIKSFIHHHERCPALCSRFWGMWTHAFSAAVSACPILCHASVFISVKRNSILITLSHVLDHEVGHTR